MSNSCGAMVTSAPRRDIAEKQLIYLNKVAKLLIAGAADESAVDFKNCCVHFRNGGNVLF